MAYLWRADTGQFLLERWYWGPFTIELIFGVFTGDLMLGSISGAMVLGSLYWRAGTREYLLES